MSRERGIRASVGVGPFRIMFGFTIMDVVIGLLFGAAVLAFFWYQYRISPLYGPPAHTPTVTVTTPAT